MPIFGRTYCTDTAVWTEEFRRRPPEGYLQIFLLEEGSIAVRLNQSRCFLQAGALLFLHDGVEVSRLYCHRLRARTVMFTPDFLIPELTIENFRRGALAPGEAPPVPWSRLFLEWDAVYTGVLPLTPPAFREAAECMDGLFRQLGNRRADGWSGRARERLKELLRLAEREYTGFVGQYGGVTPQLRQAIEYIHKNYDKDVSIETLCKVCRTNRTTLLKNFCALTGMTVGQYIRKYKLSLAKEELLLTSQSIDEIAVKCGFKQAAYFSRIFRREEGLSPSQFRCQKGKDRGWESDG